MVLLVKINIVFRGKISFEAYERNLAKLLQIELFNRNFVIYFRSYASG